MRRTLGEKTRREERQPCKREQQGRRREQRRIQSRSHQDTAAVRLAKATPPNGLLACTCEGQISSITSGIPSWLVMHTSANGAVHMERNQYVCTWVHTSPRMQIMCVCGVCVGGGPVLADASEGGSSCPDVRLCECCWRCCYSSSAARGSHLLGAPARTRQLGAAGG